jgi:signal transduction histidine kinase
LIGIAWIVQSAIGAGRRRLLDRERARIARDIHDEFGGRLSGLILDGELAQSENLDNAGASLRFSQINSGLREALEAMDEVLWAVNPRRDTVRDFVTYVCEYTHKFFQSTPIQCRLEVEAGLPALELDVTLRRNLLFAVKEAVTNAAKHSGAGNVVLQIHRRKSGLEVVVADDGRGFDPARITGERNGLGNMVMRMREAGGECGIVSGPGKGCRVEFNIPLTRRHSHFEWLTRRWRGALDREPGSVRDKAVLASLIKKGPMK